MQHILVVGTGVGFTYLIRRHCSIMSLHLVGLDPPLHHRIHPVIPQQSMTHPNRCGKQQHQDNPKGPTGYVFQLHIGNLKKTERVSTQKDTRSVLTIKL